MDKNLQELCEKYEFNEELIKYIKGVEIAYKKSLKENEKSTLYEWIKENSSIEELNNLSEKEQFLFLLGIISSYLKELLTK